MKWGKRQNTAIVVLLALILVTLAVLCVVLITNRFQPTEQTDSSQQAEELKTLQPQNSWHMRLLDKFRKRLQVLQCFLFLRLFQLEIFHS